MSCTTGTRLAVSFLCSFLSWHWDFLSNDRNSTSRLTTSFIWTATWLERLEDERAVFLVLVSIFQQSCPAVSFMDTSYSCTGLGFLVVCSDRSFHSPTIAGDAVWNLDMRLEQSSWNDSWKIESLDIEHLDVTNEKRKHQMLMLSSDSSVSSSLVSIAWWRRLDG